MAGAVRDEQAVAARDRSRSGFLAIALPGLLLLVLIALGANGLPAPLAIPRLLLGLAYVLFIPGYVLQAALFPRAGDLDGVERLGLSLGLSVAIVPVLALILDRLPWGIRLWPAVAAYGLFTLGCAAVATWRRRRLPGEERFVAVPLDLKGWWTDQERTVRILYAVLVAALLTAAIATAVILLVPGPAGFFTEFYVLGPGGLAENYPRETVVGQELAVMAGIINREREAASYRVEVWALDPWTGARSRVGTAGPVTLEPGETWQAPVAFGMPRAGDDQAVEFLLYRDGGSEPYRRLELWTNVVEAR